MDIGAIFVFPQMNGGICLKVNIMLSCLPTSWNKIQNVDKPISTWIFIFELYEYVYFVCKTKIHR